MKSFVHAAVQVDRRVLRICVPIALWTCGIGCGVLIAKGDSDIVALMHLVSSYQVSIVGLFTVLLLPLGIIAFSVLRNRPGVIYFFAAVKGLFEGYCLYGVFAVFESAAWLLRFMLFFSNTVGTVSLFWLWFRHVDGKKGTLFADLMLCFFAAAVVGVIDYLLVSPFLAMLMNHS